MASVTINNHPMTYVESGQSNPRTLVLLSGWAQDDRLFKNLAPILAKDFHVVCPNYRGHDAEQTLHGDFTAADLVDDVEAFIKAKALSNVHFVSTSHGCWVNIDLCERMKINRLLPATQGWAGPRPLQDRPPEFLRRVGRGHRQCRCDQSYPQRDGVVQRRDVDAGLP